MRSLRLIFAMGIAALPWFLKNPLYRWLFGYRIGRGVRIGFSPFLGVRRCTIGDYTRIGSLNLFYQIEDLQLGERVQIGFLNVFRGGKRIGLGSYVSILRMNVFNAIVEGDFVNLVESVLEIGTGVFIATGHWLDFSAGIRVGDHCIIGGRHSSFWTHNRQRGRAITLGCHIYLGSEVRFAPGVDVPPYCIVALGSVLGGQFSQPRMLIGGNPARVVRGLEDADFYLVIRKTRSDIPDDVALAHLPKDLLGLSQKLLRPPGSETSLDPGSGVLSTGAVPPGR